MMKTILGCILFLISCCALAQDLPSNYRIKTVAVRDTIQIDSVSINASKFVLKTKKGIVLDTTSYTVDFAKAKLFFNREITFDSVTIEYLRYPDFLTKTYKQLDESVIAENTESQQTLYKLQQSTRQNTFTPFDGLNTSGSISRGVTIGNNQNSVLNSELDLQISGKLNDKVSLRASIQDANIPLQESGYSQRLDEFDQVFIELFSDNWNIRAGDIDLVNTKSYFANFSKRVQGLSVNANINHSESKTNLFAAGALVRGQFATSQFTAQEGNQGPYKLKGSNDELYVLIVSGSETVYVNGVAVERGENKDYIIDYNAGEITFNSTFPITSEMRITVDYQYSERNYSRFTVFGGGEYESEKLKIGVSVYSESDAKNQPLQQNLSDEQKQILSEAGDNESLMIAPSYVLEDFDENRVLYKKEIIDGVEVFVFSNNPEDELYSVKFTLVGDNQGNYVIANDNAISTIYEYVAPINGVPQGNYEPIVKLVAPTKLQLAVLNGEYTPSENTNLYFELAGSKNDLNLFSSLDDTDNNGFAAKLKVNQNLVKNDTLWNLNMFVDTDFIQEDFETIERVYYAEFDRDWSLNETLGNQTLLQSGLNLMHPKKGKVNYTFEYLNYSKNFNGNRHKFFANLKHNNFNIFTNSSITKSKSNLMSSRFFRTYNKITYSLKKQWIGTKFSAEDNKQRDIQTQQLSDLSQKFTAYEIFTGIGDSTKIYAEIGYKYRVNDSLKNGELKRVNTSNTYYLKSQLIKNKQTNLGVYVNYRTLKFNDGSIDDEYALNSRINFNQNFFGNILQSNTLYETNSGSVAQQDFTYVEVEEGQGGYTWIDYNNNGIQELDEFEVAQFQDEGSYIRVLLPNQVYVKTHQNRFSQTLTLNFQQWATSEQKNKKFWAHFFNQTSFLVDGKQLKSKNQFNLNPFGALQGNALEDGFLEINNSIRNVLFFNRGKQHYTSSYTFLSNKNLNLLSIGSIENQLLSHQIDFNHKIQKIWLLNFKGNWSKNESKNQNFESRDFKLNQWSFEPKISYLFDENARFDIFYQYTSKDNTIGDKEQLLQNNYGFSFTYNSKQQMSLTGEFNYYQNTYDGDSNTPVAYQILEGLQPGKNFTWSLIAQKKLTKFLDLNLNYFGRKSETSKTIHTGTIQLRAYF